MDEAERLFKEDAREKKIIARSARHKKSHSGCNLPSDFMTKKEIEQMNGEVKVINTDLRRPLTWKYFRMLSKEEQTNYIQYLLGTFYCTGKQIAEKFKLNPTYMNKYIREQLPDIKMPHGGGYSADRLMAGAWEKFWAGEEEVKSENASESLQNAPETTSTPSEGESMVSENAAENDQNGADEAEAIERANWFKYAREHQAELLDDLDKATEAENKKSKPADVVAFSVGLRDVHDLEDILKYLRIVKWPEKNIVSLRITERVEE